MNIKVLKTIDNFFNKLFDVLVFIVIFVTLAVIGFYCDWEYKKANTKEALQEYSTTK